MDDRVPVLCTLAKHHIGDHDARGVAARSACRKVIRYEPAGTREEHVQRESEEARDGDGLPAEVCPVTYHGERCQGLVHHEKMSGYRGHYGENGFFPPEDPVSPPTPPIGPTCADRGGVVKAWIGDPPPGWKPGMRPPCIACGAASGERCKTEAPEPTTADLIANVVKFAEHVDTFARDVAEATKFHASATETLALCRSALAKRIGKGSLVSISGSLFRSVPPRKPKGGGVAEDALWRLEPVEVAR